MEAAVGAHSMKKVFSLEVCGQIRKMVRASRSQLELSSGVVAAIWPRICMPERKSLRLKATSASLRKVAGDLATGPASLLIWASSLIAASARSSRLKPLVSAAKAGDKTGDKTVERPSASVAQKAAARTRPIMGKLLRGQNPRGDKKGAKW